MHIEPGVVDGANIVLSVATATGAGAMTLRLLAGEVRERRALGLSWRVAISSLAVFTMFQVLPHQPAGVSEVHLILATSLALLFGAGSTALGLSAGLLAQGLLFAPFDLPQYGMNVTTLVVPLVVLAFVMERVIPQHTAYVDLRYSQVLRLSMTYQGGIVAWVAFWTIYGTGFSVASLTQLAIFAAAYVAVIITEPLVDLAVLATAKRLGDRSGPIFLARVWHPAA
jgi:ABC-type Co2+ transport system permease subunit